MWKPENFPYFFSLASLNILPLMPLIVLEREIFFIFKWCKVSPLLCRSVALSSTNWRVNKLNKKSFFFLSRDKVFYRFRNLNYLLFTFTLNIVFAVVSRAEPFQREIKLVIFLIYMFCYGSYVFRLNNMNTNLRLNSILLSLPISIQSYIE